MQRIRAKMENAFNWKKICKQIGHLWRSRFKIKVKPTSKSKLKLIVPRMEVQATVTECFASFITIAPLLVTSFVHEAPALTRLVWGILLSKHFSENLTFLWYSYIVLAEQSSQVLPAKDFTLKFYNEVPVVWLWIRRKLKIVSLLLLHVQPS